MAFAAYTSALLVAAVFAWLAIQHSMAAGVAQLAVAIAGNGLGGFALVLGILRDDRAQKAEASAKESEQKAAKAQRDAEQFRKEAEQFRLQAERFQQEAEAARQQVEEARHRAHRAESELERLRAERAERDNELAARVRRLELAAGLTPPDASSDATEI